MGNVVFDFAKGRWIDKCALPVGGDTIIVVLLQSSGLQADATLVTYQYLSQLTAAGNLEATFTNYTRSSITGVGITITVNTGTNVTSVSIPSQVWNSAGGATNNALGALLTCYKPSSGSPDSAIQLLTKHDFVASTTGGNLTATITTIATAT
jgi:hypothetical protein